MVAEPYGAYAWSFGLRRIPDGSQWTDWTSWGHWFYAWSWGEWSYDSSCGWDNTSCTRWNQYDHNFFLYTTYGPIKIGRSSFWSCEWSESWRCSDWLGWSSVSTTRCSCFSSSFFFWMCRDSSRCTFWFTIYERWACAAWVLRYPSWRWHLWTTANRDSEDVNNFVSKSKSIWNWVLRKSSWWRERTNVWALSNGTTTWYAATTSTAATSTIAATTSSSAVSSTSSSGATGVFGTSLAAADPVVSWTCSRSWRPRWSTTRAWYGF